MPRIRTLTIRQVWLKDKLANKDRLRLLCPFRSCEFACFGQDDETMERHLADSHPAGCISTDFSWLDANGKPYSPAGAFLANKVRVEDDEGTRRLEAHTCIVSCPFSSLVLFRLFALRGSGRACRLLISVWNIW